MTDEQRARRIHHHMYETLEGIQEHAERIVALEELVDLCYGWLITNHEKGYIIPRNGLDDIEDHMRELGIEVNE